MRENRTYGSEGGEAQAFPTPIRRRFAASDARSAIILFWSLSESAKAIPVRLLNLGVCSPRSPVE
jgi:hypothetical protein